LTIAIDNGTKKQATGSLPKKQVATLGMAIDYSTLDQRFDYGGVLTYSECFINQHTTSERFFAFGVGQ
jgi:hypothetical protein